MFFKVFLGTQTMLNSSGLMQVYQMYYYSIISFFGSSAGNISGSRVDSEAKKLLEEVIQAPLYVFHRSLFALRHAYLS